MTDTTTEIKQIISLAGKGNDKSMGALGNASMLQVGGFDLGPKVKEEQKDEDYTLLKDALADLKSAYIA